MSTNPHYLLGQAIEFWQRAAPSEACTWAPGSACRTLRYPGSRAPQRRRARAQPRGHRRRSGGCTGKSAPHPDTGETPATPPGTAFRRGRWRRPTGSIAQARVRRAPRCCTKACCRGRHLAAQKRRGAQGTPHSTAQGLQQAAM